METSGNRSIGTPSPLRLQFRSTSWTEGAEGRAASKAAASCKQNYWKNPKDGEKPKDAEMGCSTRLLVFRNMVNEDLAM